MKIIDHPYLAGVKCRDDGAVWVPEAPRHPGHWTFGSVAGRKGGYRQVTVALKRHLVHRLICEAFHGLCPPDKDQVDHFDRDPANNKPENLHWVTSSENNRNKKVCDEALTKYGVSQVDDPAAYSRAFYANNPEFRERQKAYSRAYYAKKKKSAL